MNENTCSLEHFNPTIWRRLAWKLFPSEKRYDVTEESMAYLEKEYPMAVRGKGEEGDCIHCNLTTQLSWSDRLRVLVSGRVGSVVRIVTQKHTGKLKTFAEVFPLAPGDNA